MTVTPSESEGPGRRGGARIVVRAAPNHPDSSFTLGTTTR